MKNFKQNALNSFNSPTKLPESEEEANKWQKQNYSWWQNNPMRYDWKDLIGAEEFSPEFYQEIDRRFFSNASEYLNDKDKLPFDELVDFSQLKDKDVLEIGIGNGSHAQLLASKSKSFTGIDLTDYSVRSVSERFKIFGISGAIKKMDAEKMEFSDNSFDFVWSWGVIHHSANTQKILEEIHRVLRPNGRVVIMVYHRGWWNYCLVGFLRALFGGDFFRGLTLLDSIQKHTDGAIARYYNQSDWEKMTDGLFGVSRIEIRGPKSDIIPLPGGKLKSLLMIFLPPKLNKFLARRFKMGSFLILDFLKY